MHERAARVEAAARVAASIREEIESVDRVVALIVEALAAYGEAAPGIVVVHGVGGLLQDFYTGIENVFEHIAPALNGTVHSGDAWHRELLHSMTLDLVMVRPAVIGTSTEAALVPYLRFRHLYRHMYGFRLEWSRVRELSLGVPDLWRAVRREIDAFASHLDAMVARAVGGGVPQANP